MKLTLEELKVDKRTTAQREFDWGIKGWAFARKEVLPRYLARGKELAKALAPNDKRHETLARIEEASR